MYLLKARFECNIWKEINIQFSKSKGRNDPAFLFTSNRNPQLNKSAAIEDKLGGVRNPNSESYFLVIFYNPPSMQPLKW